MKTTKMYAYTTMLVDLAKNVAFCEAKGIDYNKEAFQEELDSLVTKIEAELNKNKVAV